MNSYSYKITHKQKIVDSGTIDGNNMEAALRKLKRDKKMTVTRAESGLGYNTLPDGKTVSVSIMNATEPLIGILRRDVNISTKGKIVDCIPEWTEVKYYTRPDNLIMIQWKDKSIAAINYKLFY